MSGLEKVLSLRYYSVFLMDPGDPKLITAYSKSGTFG